MQTSMNEKATVVYEDKILMKVLTTAEMLAYMFKKGLPENIHGRYVKYVNTSPKERKSKEKREADKFINARKTGLTPEMSAASARTKWVEVAIVLPIQETTCLCGKVYSAPMGNLLIESLHPLFGVKQEILHEFDKISFLPKQTHIYYGKIKACEACFNAKETIRHEMNGIISYD